MIKTQYPQNPVRSLFWNGCSTFTAKFPYSFSIHSSKIVQTSCVCVYNYVCVYIYIYICIYILCIYIYVLICILSPFKHPQTYVTSSSSCKSSCKFYSFIWNVRFARHSACSDRRKNAKYNEKLQKHAKGMNYRWPYSRWHLIRRRNFIKLICSEYFVTSNEIIIIQS